MVNIDKLNNTINELEFRSKEIENIVEKQKNFEILAKEIEYLKGNINKESKLVTEITKELNKLISDSKKKVVETEKIIDERFTDVEGVLKDNGKEVTTSLYKFKETIVDESKKYLNNAFILEEEIKKTVNKIDKLNDDVIKKLNEVIMENNKAINKYHNILDTQIGLLKSDIQLQFRSIDESLNRQIKEGNNKVIDIVNELQEKLDKMNEARVKSDKTNKIIIIMILILTIGNIVSLLIL